MTMSTAGPAIRRQLIQMVLLTSGAVLLLTVTCLFAYDFLTFRQTSQRQLDTLGRAIAANSTAALAFNNSDDAQTVLSAFEVDPHITHAALYRLDGVRFAVYPSNAAAGEFPAQLKPEGTGFRFGRSDLVGILPVIEGQRRMGTLFVQSDLGAIYDRMRSVPPASWHWWWLRFGARCAYALSRRLQQRISGPILALAQMANAISTRHDYSVRASNVGAFELDQLTDAFNHMLGTIQGFGSTPACAAWSFEPAATHHARHRGQPGPREHRPGGRDDPGTQHAPAICLYRALRCDRRHPDGEHRGGCQPGLWRTAGPATRDRDCPGRQCHCGLCQGTADPRAGYPPGCPCRCSKVRRPRN